jgi:hypothetical protein
VFSVAGCMDVRDPGHFGSGVLNREFGGVEG